jgi:PIN domain nuclease of toxin-antitoxin system
MNLLLDSHALLWLLLTPDEILKNALREFQNPENALFYSAASAWELELKMAKGKLYLPDDWLKKLNEAGYKEVPIHAKTAKSSTRLPLHHRDPFDRLLIAQCLEHGLTFATRDSIAARYGIPLLSV